MPIIWREEFEGPLSLSTDAVPGRWRTRGQDDFGSLSQGYVDYAGSSWNISPIQHPAHNPFSVANSVLTVTAKRNPGLAGVSVPWVGGYLVSDFRVPDQTFRYGYFEWRMRLPNSGRGMFPALWLFSNDAPGTNNGKQAAEIDVVEVFGSPGGSPWAAAMHRKPVPGVTRALGYFPEETAQWHRYGVEWTPDVIRIYRDGVLKAQATPEEAQWYQGVPMGIRINYAMDPNWEPAGSSVRSTATDPPLGTELRMEVDYVRVYDVKPANLAQGAADPEAVIFVPPTASIAVADDFNVPSATAPAAGSRPVADDFNILPLNPFTKTRRAKTFIGGVWKLARVKTWGGTDWVEREIGGSVVKPSAPVEPTASVTTIPTPTFTDPTTQIALTYSAPAELYDFDLLGYRFGYVTTDPREVLAGEATYVSAVYPVASSPDPFVFTTLVENATYDVYVEAVTVQGPTSRKTVRTKTAAVSPVPGAPATSSITNLTPTTLTINWTPPLSTGVAAPTGYTVSWGGWTSAVVPATERMMPLTNFVANTPYSIEIRAVNAAGSGPAKVQTVTTPTVASQPTGNPALLGLPSRITALYVTGWTDNPVNCTSIPQSYNVQYLFAASRGSTNGEVIWGYSVPSNITTARQRGTRIIISTGGAGQGINFNTRSVSQAFVNSIVALNTRFGGTLANPVFDGLDFNTFEAEAVPNLTEYLWMAFELKSLFGANFIISSPPAPWRETDWVFCREMLSAGAMDYAAPQYYDSPELATSAVIAGTGRSSVTMWVNDIALGNASKIAVGFGYNGADPAYSTMATILQSWNTIEARHPTIRGAFLWQHATDRSQNWRFANEINPLILS